MFLQDAMLSHTVEMFHHTFTLVCGCGDDQSESLCGHNVWRLQAHKHRSVLRTHCKMQAENRGVQLQCVQCNDFHTLIWRAKQRAMHWRSGFGEVESEFIQTFLWLRTRSQGVPQRSPQLGGCRLRSPATRCRNHPRCLLRSIPAG